MEYDDDLVVVERNRSNNQVAGFLLGLAVGAGIALLFAPQSGARTRADIARRARKARRAAASLATDFRQRAGHAFEGARTEVRRRVDSARDNVEGVIDDVKVRVEAGREAGMVGARAAREDLQRRLAEARARDGGEPRTRDTGMGEA